MVICVKCCATTLKSQATKNGWIRIAGRWYCSKCKSSATIIQEKDTENKKKNGKERQKKLNKKKNGKERQKK